MAKSGVRARPIAPPPQRPRGGGVRSARQSVGKKRRGTPAYASTLAQLARVETLGAILMLAALLFILALLVRISLPAPSRKPGRISRPAFDHACRHARCCRRPHLAQSARSACRELAPVPGRGRAFRRIHRSVWVSSALSGSWARFSIADVTAGGELGQLLRRQPVRRPHLALARSSSASRSLGLGACSTCCEGRPAPSRLSGAGTCRTRPCRGIRAFVNLVFPTKRAAGRAPLADRRRPGCRRMMPSPRHRVPGSSDATGRRTVYRGRPQAGARCR